MKRAYAGGLVFVLPWAFAGAMVGGVTGGTAVAAWMAGAGAVGVAALAWWQLVARHAVPRIDQAIGAGAIAGLLAPDVAVALSIVAWRWFGPGRAAPGWGPAELALPVIALLLAISGAIGGVGLGMIAFWLGRGASAGAEAGTPPRR